MALLFSPYFRATDPSNAPIPGAFLSFYATQTSTFQPIYSDSALTIPAQNPLQADGNGVFGAVWLDDSLPPYKTVLQYPDINDPTIPGAIVAGPNGTLDPYNSALSAAAIEALLMPATPSEIAAGVTPTNLSIFADPYDLRREGATLNNSGDDTVAVNNTLLVASEPVGGSQGGAIIVPQGTALLSSMITLPNRVRVLGQNKRGSYFKAKAGFSGSWMFNAKNGTSSMFDSTLENVTIDANSLPGLGCVLSDAWQEDCGLRAVLLIGFTTVGIKYQSGFGGASFSNIKDTEIFGGSVAGSIGIDVEKMSASGAVFILDVQDTSIVGGTAKLSKGINIVAENLHCDTVHFEDCEVAIYLNGAGNHVLQNVTAAPTVTTVIQIDAAFTGTVQILGAYRNGATNLIVDNRVKQIAQLGTVTGGSGYVDGTYGATTQVPLTGGSGTNATAVITVAGGAVTSVSLGNPGTGYNVGDTLSASNANLGGSGSGFSIPVFQNFTGLGTVAGRDYPELQLVPCSNLSNPGACTTRSPFNVMAWGQFDGTVTGTNAPAVGQNVLSIQRTGAGRYTVTLANSAASLSQLLPVANCSNPSLMVASQSSGGASFTISINNTSLAATDSSDVHFMVAGL